LTGLKKKQKQKTVNMQN